MIYARRSVVLGNSVAHALCRRPVNKIPLHNSSPLMCLCWNVLSKSFTLRGVEYNVRWSENIFAILWPAAWTFVGQTSNHTHTQTTCLFLGYIFVMSSWSHIWKFGKICTEYGSVIHHNAYIDVRKCDALKTILYIVFQLCMLLGVCNLRF